MQLHQILASASAPSSKHLQSSPAQFQFSSSSLLSTFPNDPCRVTNNTRWCRPWRFTSFTTKPVLGADFLCRVYLPAPVTTHRDSAHVHERSAQYLAVCCRTFLCDRPQVIVDVCPRPVRGLIGVSMARGEGKFVSARPYESCKILKDQPRRNAFSKLVHRQYKSFRSVRFCQEEMKISTRLSNKTSLCGGSDSGK